MNIEIERLWDKLSECRAEGMSPRATATAILTYGYRPPAREFTTAAELDALPDRTVVLDCDGDAWRRAPDFGGMWMVTGSDISHCAADVAEFAPLTLLHFPTEATS